jgi:hypothetical protein
MSKIICRIAKDGTVTVEVDGMKGEGCHDVTRAFQLALGQTVEEVTKPEYYDQIDDIEAQVFETEPDPE